MINGLMASGSTLAGEFKQFAEKEMASGLPGTVKAAAAGAGRFINNITGGAAGTGVSMAGEVAGETGDQLRSDGRDYAEFYGMASPTEQGNYAYNMYNDGTVSAQNPPDGQPFADKIKNKLKGAIGAGINSYNNINSFFGGEITANPLPVRVSFGHYVDLEPMVIRNVKISSSAEQFISPDGTHLPVFVTADVTVEYWMQPGPDKEFMSFLGNEVFEEFIDRSTPVGKNKDDGKINSGTPKK
jgi:hypothetical protein